jgi:predicted DNA-binding transcriptional regulator YafY
MARPTARVLALLEILQAGGTHTAADLADRLDVDERTVRRYVEHLVDLDVPVWAERGRYGGFRLAAGYRMPPLMLTDGEALAVVLGLVAAGRVAGVPSSEAAVDSAAAKVRRVLPQRLGARIGALLETAGFTGPSNAAARAPGGNGMSAPEADILLAVAEAARDRRALAIRYRSADDRLSERTLRPYAVVAHSGRWYVTGADSASGQERTFRLDRIGTARLLDETFDAPDARDPADRLLDALAAAPRREAVSVLVRAAAEHIDRRIPRGLATVEPLVAEGEGWVRLRLQVEQLDWVPSLLAGIDRPFVIEEPAALREHVRSLGERLIRYAASAELP